MYGVMGPWFVSQRDTRQIDEQARKAFRDMRLATATCMQGVGNDLIGRKVWRRIAASGSKGTWRGLDACIK
jgi:hypothetical protein